MKAPPGGYGRSDCVNEVRWTGVSPASPTTHRSFASIQGLRDRPGGNVVEYASAVVQLMPGEA